MIELYVTIALLVASNAFWAHVCLKLTNKLMSRDFFEYKTVESPRKATGPKVVLEERDEYAETQASQLNAIMNIG